jgi:hypothetical protein
MIHGRIKFGPADIGQFLSRGLVLNLTPPERRNRLRLTRRVPDGKQFHRHVIVRDQQPRFVLPDRGVGALVLDYR